MVESTFFYIYPPKFWNFPNTEYVMLESVSMFCPYKNLKTGNWV